MLTQYSPDTIPWIEKYRPNKIADLEQNEELMKLFNNCINTNNITHYLFHGPPGTGKTSAILAIGREIFGEHFSERVIEFNASDDRGISAVRGKITYEARKYVAEIVKNDGRIIPAYKIIILDEADSMTDEAQDALRVIIEEHSTVTRFCFICNYFSKITEAIKSRCSIVYFRKLSHESIVKKLESIAANELMLDRSIAIDTIIKVSNGDMRRAVMLLQNSKYLYEYKKQVNKGVDMMTYNELEMYARMGRAIPEMPYITEEEIYSLAVTYTEHQIIEIIQNTVQCKNVREISRIAKDIMCSGYPIDGILESIVSTVVKYDNFTDDVKTDIILGSGEILYRIKKTGNAYIQLLNFLTKMHIASKN
jgi:replication factor C subunit 2/4